MSTSFMPTDAFMLTAEERDLLPSDSGVQWYAEHGWYLSKKLLTDAEAGALSAASEQIYAGKRDRVLPLRPPNLAYWEPSDGQVQRHNDYVHYESDDFARILRKPLIGAVAARLAGSSEIRIFQATLIYKPPVRDEETNLVPWHADRHYWQTCTSERMLTAFIPFHDCGEEMGTITIIDGSHRWKEPPGGDDSTRHFAQRDRGELDALLAETARFNGAEVTATPMVIPKGHMSFHHCRVYHGSGANVSGRPRRCVSLHMQDGENQWRRYLRPDGGTVVYNNDVLVRSTGAGTPDYADPEYCPVIWRA
ncbi:MAG TPA: phytanoyl-CoA dioxygenase family protein [Streptosporangiaceae bacterium]|nr:phytanoyl-CoA dioxygenase family protein [Streptosporangiaceae bacterium]